MRWSAVSLLGLSGCLWISVEEHEGRTGASTATTDTGTTITTATTPPMDLRLEPLLDVVGACGEDSLLQGSLDAAYLDQTPTAQLQIGQAPPRPVALPLSARDGRASFTVVVPYDDTLSCAAEGCMVSVSLAVTAGEVVDDAAVDAQFLPASSSVVDSVRVGGVSVDDGSEVVTVPIEVLEVELTDPRMGEDFEGAELFVCPAGGGLTDPSCVRVVQGASWVGDTATLSTAAEALVKTNAPCSASRGQGVGRRSIRSRARSATATGAGRSRSRSTQRRTAPIAARSMSAGGSRAT